MVHEKVEASCKASWVAAGRSPAGVGRRAPPGNGYRVSHCVCSGAAQPWQAPVPGLGSAGTQRLALKLDTSTLVG